ncbi:hypothetical protein RUND412_001783 [Rhizina undulata]
MRPPRQAPPIAPAPLRVGESQGSSEASDKQSPVTPTSKWAKTIDNLLEEISFLDIMDNAPVHAMKSAVHSIPQAASLLIGHRKRVTSGTQAQSRNELKVPLEENAKGLYNFRLAQRNNSSMSLASISSEMTINTTHIPGMMAAVKKVYPELSTEAGRDSFRSDSTGSVNSGSPRSVDMKFPLPISVSPPKVSTKAEQILGHSFTFASEAEEDTETEDTWIEQLQKMSPYESFLSTHIDPFAKKEYDIHKDYPYDDDSDDEDFDDSYHAHLVQYELNREAPVKPTPKFEPIEEVSNEDEDDDVTINGDHELVSVENSDCSTPKAPVQQRMSGESGYRVGGRFQVGNMGKPVLHSRQNSFEALNCLKIQDKTDEEDFTSYDSDSSETASIADQFPVPPPFNFKESGSAIESIADQSSRPQSFKDRRNGMLPILEQFPMPPSLNDSCNDTLSMADQFPMPPSFKVVPHRDSRERQAELGYELNVPMADELAQRPPVSRRLNCALSPRTLRNNLFTMPLGADTVDYLVPRSNNQNNFGVSGHRTSPSFPEFRSPVTENFNEPYIPKPQNAEHQDDSVYNAPEHPAMRPDSALSSHSRASSRASSRQSSTTGDNAWDPEESDNQEALPLPQRTLHPRTFQSSDLDVSSFRRPRLQGSRSQVNLRSGVNANTLENVDSSEEAVVGILMGVGVAL